MNLHFSSVAHQYSSENEQLYKKNLGFITLALILFVRTIVQAQRIYGNKWTEISKVVSGRCKILFHYTDAFCLLSSALSNVDP